MSIPQRLARLFGQGRTESKAFTLTSPEAYGLFAGLPVRSGVTVTSTTALRVPAVAAAVGLISEACGNLPFKLHDRDTREAQKDHPGYELIHGEANPWTSAEELREHLTRDALLSGSGFAQVVRNGIGQPLELHRIDPGAVSVETDDYGEPSYRIRLKGGGDTVLPYTDVLHISTLDGVSPITHAKEAIGLALAAEQHLAEWFGRAGRPSGYLSTEQDLKPDPAKKIIDGWSAVKAGSAAILDNGMRYYPLATSNTDAEFYTNRIEQIREIARAFRIPPSMIFELERGTWSNVEQMAQQFLTMTLRPWLKRWQAAYARVLLSPEDRRALYIEAETKDLMTVDFAAQATAYSQYVAMRAMTPNEVRAGLNLPPMAGGDELSNPFTTSGGTTATPEPAKEAPNE
ncbi:phage portal protein [Paracoccus versutus]|uniref:HK97 family phage portal protein n=1 Tax=Paracoccus versutus TaxID=34007 RepID=A0A3D9XIL1_PARVE|nr:phage portal protein [Paracoccus versutus]REF70270.1 HK97 family phage portal protein [Paracoccus versutus]WGR57411.1 phage portal protein [Paracoccus versutus]